MENKLVGVCIFMNQVNSKIVDWSDSSSEDYIYRPQINKFEIYVHMESACTIKSTWHKMKLKTTPDHSIKTTLKEVMTQMTTQNIAITIRIKLKDTRFWFIDEHSNNVFSCLDKLKKWVFQNYVCQKECCAKLEIYKIKTITLATKEINWEKSIQK